MSEIDDVNQDRRIPHGRRAGALVERLHQEGIPRGIVLDAIRYVPRELFVPEDARGAAWENRPLEIGEGQTISQPYTVAYMLQLAEIGPAQRVMEVGAGSGYVVALLSYMVGDPSLVTGVELNEELFQEAQQRLSDLGLDGVHLVHGDGKDGCPQRAPYDAIIVSAQTDEVPSPLLEQLSAGGRLVVPVDVGSYAAMTRITRTETGFERSRHGAFQFVPLQ
ncbi:MAG: protein-L-isoaspartate(D-aspartate) O-methyltransferase [Alkalispirochaeta sp.]